MVQEKLEQIVALAQQASAELPVELQAKYDQGFTEGAASVGSDVIYTQAELDAKLAEQASTYETQIAELQAQVDAFPEQLEVEKTKAVAAKMAQLKTAYETQQVAESQGETGFGSMLV